jgi:predicted small secreted protein
MWIQIYSMRLFLMKRQTISIMILIISAVLLTACGETVENIGLPTRVELPADVVGNPTPDVANNAPTQAVSGLSTLPPEWTATATPTRTETATITPSMTITDTPSPTASITFTPSVTPTETLESAPLLSLADLAARITDLPPTYAIPADFQQVFPTPITFGTSSAPVNCTIASSGGFATALQADSGLGTTLGCASGNVIAIQSATQVFERGVMVWVNEGGGLIYVFNNNGTFQRYPDTFIAGQDPDSGGEAPPPGLIEPVRGFGKIWRTMAGVRDGIGWGISPEAGDSATIQEFANGRMMYLPTRGNILALTYSGSANSGTWRILLGTY